MNIISTIDCDQFLEEIGTPMELVPHLKDFFNGHEKILFKKTESEIIAIQEIYGSSPLSHELEKDLEGVIRKFIFNNHVLTIKDKSILKLKCEIEKTISSYEQTKYKQILDLGFPLNDFLSKRNDLKKHSHWLNSFFHRFYSFGICRDSLLDSFKINAIIAFNESQGFDYGFSFSFEKNPDLKSKWSLRKYLQEKKKGLFEDIGEDITPENWSESIVLNAVNLNHSSLYNQDLKKVSSLEKFKVNFSKQLNWVLGIGSLHRNMPFLTSEGEIPLSVILNLVEGEETHLPANLEFKMELPMGLYVNNNSDSAICPEKVTVPKNRLQWIYLSN